MSAAGHAKGCRMSGDDHVVGHGVAAYLAIVTIAATATTLWLWPSHVEDPVLGLVEPAPFVIPEDATVVLRAPGGILTVGVQGLLQALAAMGGVLGACLYCIHSHFEHFATDKDFDAHFVWWYVLHPPLGAAIGFGGAAVLHGLGALMGDVVDLPTTAAAPLAVGILAGVSTRHSIGWMREQSSRLFRRTDREAAALAVHDASVKRIEGRHILHVVGDGFGKSARLFADALELVIEKRSLDRIEAEVPDSFRAKRIEVRVGRARASLAIPVEVPIQKERRTPEPAAEEAPEEDP